jgi:quercetin dioxygenase-like cupin family protein
VVHASTRKDIAYIRTPRLEEMNRKVVRLAALKSNPASPLATAGVREAAIIGTAPSADGFAAAPIDNAHGFTIRHLQLDVGASTPWHARDCAEVLLVHRGRVLWRNDNGESAELNAGDTFTVPRGMPRRIEAVTAAEVYAVRGGDDPGPVQLLQKPPA